MSLGSRIRRSCSAITMIVLVAVPTLAQSPAAEKACADLVQGTISWDNQGHTVWSPDSVHTLCAGSSNPSEPPRCFDRVMRGGIDWGGGTQWLSQDALNLCAGTNNADATISCFQARIAQGTQWAEASRVCGGSATRIAPVLSNAPIAIPATLAPGRAKLGTDFDGDGKADLGVFRPAEGKWYVHPSSGGTDRVMQFGGANDKVVPGDYDGDGKDDYAVYRPSNSTWYVRPSTGGPDRVIQFGVATDVPVPGDYDGDRKTDCAVFRRPEGKWYIRPSSGGPDRVMEWGEAGDSPTPGRYDSDGKLDYAVFRPSSGLWLVRPTSGATDVAEQFGAANDIPVPGDYDGDGRTDYAVFRPSNGTWYVKPSKGGPDVVMQFGAATDVVVPGDYDGDGRDDWAVFRPSNGTWYVRQSSGGPDRVTAFGTGTDFVWNGRVAPRVHTSPEAGAGQTQCTLSVLGESYDARTGDRPILPEWVFVDDARPRSLEGVVVELKPGNRKKPEGPHVSHDDAPISHDTHDFTFQVRPDATPDGRYTSLLGVQIRHTAVSQQPLIEVEWETGLAAYSDDSINPCQTANDRGDSCGFFSAGHRRGETIWNWPTLNDHIYVEGAWVWDRGHAPAVTEIHPPQLVAIQRDLPMWVRRDPVTSNRGALGTPLVDVSNVLATRVDIFASIDGSALWQSRTARPGSTVPPYNQVARLDDRDPSFSVSNPLPRPSPAARLKWRFEPHRPPDTFTAEAIVDLVPGDPTSVLITLPWNSKRVDNAAVFARTLYLYWEEGNGGNGVPSSYRPRVFQVTLDNVCVRKSQDYGNDGEYRLFAEVAGNWLFVNESAGDDRILENGLGDTGDCDCNLQDEDATWGINRPTFRGQYQVIVPPGRGFRVHAGGWEADGANTKFGELIDPNAQCDSHLVASLLTTIFSPAAFANGAEDDPIGEVNDFWWEGNRFGVGPQNSSAAGEPTDGIWTSQNTDPDDSFRLRYHIDEVPFPPR